MFIFLEDNGRLKFEVTGNSRLQVLQLVEDKKLNVKHVEIKDKVMYSHLISHQKFKEGKKYNFVLGERGKIEIVFGEHDYFSKLFIPQKDAKMGSMTIKFDPNEKESQNILVDDRITCLCFGDDDAYGCPIHTLQKSNRLISSDDEYDEYDDLANNYFDDN